MRFPCNTRRPRGPGPPGPGGQRYQESAPLHGSDLPEGPELTSEGGLRLVPPQGYTTLY